MQHYRKTSSRVSSMKFCETYGKLVTLPKIGFIEIIWKYIQRRHKLIVFSHHRSMNKYLILFLIILLVLSILCTALKLSFENSNEKKLWYLPVEDLSVSNLFLINRCTVWNLKIYWNIDQLFKEQLRRADSFL